jgi:hypothetical protein
MLCQSAASLAIEGSSFALMMIQVVIVSSD